MTLTELKYIVAVARERHFGKAAEACYVSQPTLSVAVKKLEEELDIKLFERSANEVTVTPLGEEIVRQAQSVLEQAAEIKEIAKRGKDPLGGSLTLGIIYTIGPYLLPDLVRQIIARTPQMPLMLQENFTVKLLEMLRTGEINPRSTRSANRSSMYSVCSASLSRIMASSALSISMPALITA